VSAELVIAVHPPFAWLVAWEALAAAGPRWVLVTSAASRDHLAREGRLGALADVVVPPSYDLATLSDLIAPWVDRAPGHTRVATMIEPLQIVVAELRRRFGLPGPMPDELLPFTNKLAMKSAMREVGDLLPRYLPHDRAAFRAEPDAYLRRVERALGLPVFAKPVSENSSAGTAKLETPAQLRAFLESSPHELELDEHIDAVAAYHLDAVVVGGAVRWFGCGRYLAPQGESLSGAPLAGSSIAQDEPLFGELERLNARLLGAFDRVPDGCTHLEILRRPDGRCVFLEVAARTPGCRMPEMHRIHRGVDLRVIHYAVAAGLPVEGGRTGPHAGWYSPMKTEPGRIARLVDPPFGCEHEGEWQRSWLAREDVARTMSMADCLGFFVVWDRDRARLDADLSRLATHRPYELEPG
jgi:hypothetical protein